MRNLTSTSLIATLLLASVVEVRADFISDTLGTAGPSNYSLLSIGTGNSDVAFSGPGTSTGNVGVLSGKLSLSSSTPPAIIGNVYYGSGASSNFSASNQLQGTVFTGQQATLTQARTDALNASSTFAGLTPTLSVSGGAITSSMTLNGSSGVNVVNISNLNLNGETLTLNGAKGSMFVINDSGNFVLNSGKITLTGGLTANDVVFNITGPANNAVQTSGGGNASEINGIILAPNSGTAFSPALVNGEVIAGGSTIHFASGAEVIGQPAATPAPPSVILLGLGGVALLVVSARSRRHPVAVAC